jgi:hypothetical protein
MGVSYYTDVHVPGPITRQLRSRGVDVLTAQEDEHETAPDHAILERAASLGRLVFTQDVRFRILAEQWQQNGRYFPGLLFGPQLAGSIGAYIDDLALIAIASDPDEWQNVVQFLPFKRSR